MNKNVKVPTTLNECFEALTELLNDGERDQLMMCPDRDVIQYHHGLGRFIRNEWGLWQGGPLSKHLMSIGLRHPDDMSTIIVEAYRANLRKESYDINSKIEKYKEYWDKVDNEQICSD